MEFKKKRSSLWGENSANREEATPGANDPFSRFKKETEIIYQVTLL